MPRRGEKGVLQTEEEEEAEEVERAGCWRPARRVCFSEGLGLCPTGRRGGGVEGPSAGGVISGPQPR